MDGLVNQPLSVLGVIIVLAANNRQASFLRIRKPHGELFRPPFTKNDPGGQPEIRLAPEDPFSGVQKASGINRTALQTPGFWALIPLSRAGHRRGERKKAPGLAERSELTCASAATTRCPKTQDTGGFFGLLCFSAGRKVIITIKGIRGR
jgi:hypothetical protein